MTHAVNYAYQANKYTGMSPERIVLAMFEGATAAIGLARTAIQENDVAGRGQAISRALAIIGELQASLNFEAGAAIADQLSRLYDYVCHQLLCANLRADVAALEDAGAIIGQLSDGWEEMLKRSAAPSVVAAVPPTPSPPEPSSERKSSLVARTYSRSM